MHLTQSNLCQCIKTLSFDLLELSQMERFLEGEKFPPPNPTRGGKFFFEGCWDGFENQKNYGEGERG